MTHLLIVLALLQPAQMGPPTACADDAPIGARIGQPAPCTGVLISAGDSRKMRSALAQVGKLQLRVDFGLQRIERITLERDRDADRLDRVLDKGLQLHAETIAEATVCPWYECPGWSGVGLAFGTGAAVAILEPWSKERQWGKAGIALAGAGVLWWVLR